MNIDKNSHLVGSDLVTSILQRIINMHMSFQKNLGTLCTKLISHTLRVKRPLSEPFMVRIFPHLDWLQKFRVQICRINLCIRSEYTKIRKRKNFDIGHFLHSDIHSLMSYSSRHSWKMEATHLVAANFSSNNKRPRKLKQILTTV